MTMPHIFHYLYPDYISNNLYFCIQNITIPSIGIFNMFLRSIFEISYTIVAYTYFL